MAQDSDLSKAADKGKGKATDSERKPDEAQKDKAGQPVANGKDDKAECLFSYHARSSHASVSAPLTVV